jgi:hypothetical protein
MGDHDQHLPRKDLNRAADTKGATDKDKKEHAAVLGKGTKQDAKEAKKGRRP